MSLYELNDGALTPIASTTFTTLGLRERAQIQSALRHHISAITPGVRTMVICEEFGDWIDASRRIDLLCLDEDGCLVVVELKRDNSGHMELQALRYAAMVSAMTFDQAIEAHRGYLKKIQSDADPESAIREFLEVEEGPVAFSDTVRIVLAALDYSTELTTAVLWLNKQGRLDIRCVQMRPHNFGGRTVLDIQQVIPLPAAQQYQVALRQKTIQQEAVARNQTRDMTRYDLSVGDTDFTHLPKRRLMYQVVYEAMSRGVAPARLAQAAQLSADAMFVSADGVLDADGLRGVAGRPLERFYAKPADLLHFNGRTYALSRQWGSGTIEAIEKIIALLPEGPAVAFAPTSDITEEVSYEGYAITRRASGTIEVEKDGETVMPAKPALRVLADKLGISPLNGKGNDFNTRQLGAEVIRAVAAL